MSGKIKLLICDKCRLLCDGLFSILNNQEGYIVLDTLTDGEALIESARKCKPDIIVANCCLPKISGIDACCKLNLESNEYKFLFLADNIEKGDKDNCIKAGGYGLISKDIPKSLLMLALENISEGNKYFDDRPDIGQLKIASEHFSDSSSLTRQERSILNLIESGYKSKEIADICNISKRTVDAHRYHLSKKLNNSLDAEFEKKSYDIKKKNKY